MRILIAHDVARTRLGGMQRIMELIHRELAQRGHSIDFLCAEDRPTWARGRAGRFAFPLLVLARVQRATTRGEPYDIVNVHEPQGSLATLWRRLSDARPVVVVTTHGVESRAWALALEERRLHRVGPGLRTRWLFPLTTLWQARLSLKLADHVLCLNEEDRAYLASEVGVEQRRITRIFPGASSAFDQGALVRDYARCRTIVFGGTWRKNKGIEDLVPAFTRVARSRPAVRLMCLGAGAPEQVVRAAFPSDVMSRVDARDTASEDETAAVLADADVFVLPSLFEGTPLGLIEAMRSGLPVVTTATCGMKDVIEGEVNGVLVPIRSPDAIAGALMRLLDDAPLRARLGRSARDRACAHYTWPLAAAPVLRAYERLLGDSGAGTP